MGTGMKTEESGRRLKALGEDLEALGPVQAFESLTGEKAPKALVDAELRIDSTAQSLAALSLSPPPDEDEESKPIKDKEEDDAPKLTGNVASSSSSDSRCVNWYRITGNNRWTRNTYYLYGYIEPYRGGLYVSVKEWNGYRWVTLASDYAPQNGWAYAWAYGGNYWKRITTSYATGDGYHAEICT